MSLHSLFCEDDVVRFITKEEYYRVGHLCDCWVPTNITQHLDRFGGQEVTICEVDTEDGPGKYRYAIYEDDERWLFPEFMFSVAAESEPCTMPEFVRGDRVRIVNDISKTLSGPEGYVATSVYMPQIGEFVYFVVNVDVSDYGYDERVRYTYWFEDELEFAADRYGGIEELI